MKSSAKPTEDREMKRLILKFGLTQASVTAIGGVIAPIMYLMFQDKGLSLEQIGWLVAASTITGVMFEIPFGTLADNFGRRKVFLLGELVLLVVVTGLWLANSFEVLALFMALNGISTALFSGTLDALFIEKFYAHKEKGSIDLLQAQASFGIFQILGLAVGSLLAGFIPGWMEDLTVYSGYVSQYIDYYETNYIVLIPLILIHMLVTKLVIEESALVKSSNRFKSTFNSLGPFIKVTTKSIVSSPFIQVMLIIDFIGGLAFISLGQLWQPRLAEIINDKESTWLFGLLFAVNSVFMAVGQGLSIPLSKIFKNNYAPMLVLVEFVLGGLFIVFAFQESLAGFIVAYCALFLVSGMSVAPFMTMFHTAIEESQRSTMLSVKSLMTQGGATLGALVAGYLAGYYSIRLAWIISGCIMFISALFYLFPVISNFTRELAQSLTKENEEVKQENEEQEPSGVAIEKS